MPYLIFQHGIYDAQWLYEVGGIRVRGYRNDPRIRHHAAYPELPSSLPFLVSLYADDLSGWKSLVKANEDLK